MAVFASPRKAFTVHAKKGLLTPPAAPSYSYFLRLGNRDQARAEGVYVRYPGWRVGTSASDHCRVVVVSEGVHPPAHDTAACVDTATETYTGTFSKHFKFSQDLRKLS